MKTFMLAAFLMAGMCLSQGSAALAQSATGVQASKSEQDAQAQEVELMRKDIGPYANN